jgi:hypothetical protein
VAFCALAAVLSVAELNIRAVVRTIRLALNRDFRRMFHGLFFIVGANIAVAAGLFVGLLLARLGHLHHFNGTLREHDLVRIFVISLPVVMVCMGMLAVLNRFVADNNNTPGIQS